MDQFQFREFVSSTFGHPSLQDYDDFCRRMAPVKFTTDTTGTCKVGTVILHSDCKGTVSAGDVWFCELSAMASRKYIGKPIQKVDAEFMTGLSKDQMQSVAEALWNQSKDAVVPYLESWFKDEKGLISEEEHRADLDALKEMYSTEIAELEGEHNAELSGKDEELASLRREYEERISSMAAEMDAAMRTIDRLNNEIVTLRRERDAVRSATDLVRAVPSPDTMMRTGEDTLSMSSLADGTYTVTVSADGRRIRMWPDPKGRAVCESGSMTLRGLGAISPFDGVVALRYALDGSTGVYSVDLCGSGSA